MKKYLLWLSPYIQPVVCRSDSIDGAVSFFRRCPSVAASMKHIELELLKSCIYQIADGIDPEKPVLWMPGNSNDFRVCYAENLEDARYLFNLYNAPLRQVFIQGGGCCDG